MKATLEYLAIRFEGIGCDAAQNAAALARKSLQRLDVFETSPLAEHALYHELWNRISVMIDHADFPDDQRIVASALEFELAGHTLMLRLSLGWLTRSEIGPTEFPALDSFYGKKSE